MKQIRVLFAAAELTPLAKAGGLGDVVGALPKALQPLVHNLVVAIPFHAEIQPDQLPHLKRVDSVTVRVQDKAINVGVWQSLVPGSATPLLLFKQADFLSRGAVYDGRAVLNPITRRPGGGAGVSIRYLFFSYAVQAYLKKRPNRFTLVHCHDFHLAPLPALIAHDAVLSHIKTVLTIHNLYYTGPTPRSYWDLFKPSLYHLFDATEAGRTKGPRMFWLGIRYANFITTVSQQYAKEILTPEYGNELELLLQKRKHHLSSVLNGIDTHVFNPARDPAVHTTFTSKTINRRIHNKFFLQRRCKLPVSATMPVIGIVSRLAPQKGFGLIVNAIDQLSSLPVQFVVCGKGAQLYTHALRDAEECYPHQWHFHGAFDIVFSQYVYAGCDIFLMPSRHEPCGLAQLIAMRYGAVPVVRATGGLSDTVKENYNGFMFSKYSSAAMLAALKRAIKTYQSEPIKWKRLMEHGMTENYGWKQSASEYAKLYRKLLRSG